MVPGKFPILPLVLVALAAAAVPAHVDAAPPLPGAFSWSTVVNNTDEMPGAPFDGEPARWRSSSFVAVSADVGATFKAAFKAVRGDVVGIYLGKGPRIFGILTVLDTTMGGQALDPEAPEDSTITEVGLEREGLRGDWFVINAKMGFEGGTEDDGMAGIYLTRLPVSPPR